MNAELTKAASVLLKKAADEKQAWISKKIALLIREGKPKDQAAAIAYSMWERGDTG